MRECLRPEIIEVVSSISKLIYNNAHLIREEFSFDDFMKNIEAGVFDLALGANYRNRTKAAISIGIKRTTLVQRMRKYGIK